MIDWTGTELPEVTSALGQKAFEAAKLYFGLSDEQKAVLTTEEKETVIRAAAVYGYGEWSKAAGYYETVFKANGAGGVEVVAEKVEDVEQIKPSLIADDKKLIEYTKVVYAISEEFADTVLYGETKIGSYLKAVYSDELVEEAVTYACTQDSTQDNPHETCLDNLRRVTLAVCEDTHYTLTQQQGKHPHQTIVT